MSENNPVELTVRAYRKVTMPDDVQEGDILKVTYELLHRPEDYKRRTRKSTNDSDETE